MFSGLGPDIELCFLTPAGSPEEAWAQSFLDPARLLSFDLNLQGERYSDFNTEKILLNSNLAEVLPARGVSALMITHRGTPAIKAWSARCGIRIIATALRHQVELEDKVWFERFLNENELPKPTGAVVRGGLADVVQACRQARLGERLVVQEPRSFGSAGTWFCCFEELPDLFAAGTLTEGSEYLIRSRVDGSVFGITVFIENGLIALSALRRQCFWDNTDPERLGIFAGISWTADQELDPGVKSETVEVFWQLGQLLYERSFRGFANFDFIVNRLGAVLVLECNPRLSSASSQLFRFPELLGGVNAAPGFIRESLRPQAYVSAPRCLALPPSDFRGGLIDIPAPSSSALEQMPPIGLYRVSGGRAEFSGPDVRAFSRSGPQLIFYSECRPGETYSAGTTIGSLVSNFPLFDAYGRCTSEARGLVEQFSCGQLR